MSSSSPGLLSGFLLGLALLAAPGCFKPTEPERNGSPLAATQEPPTPAASQVNPLGTPNPQGADFVIGSGRRIIPHEYLPPVQPNFVEGRNRLLKYLKEGREEDLREAYRLLDDKGTWSDWWSAIHAAWCLELLGDAKGRDKLIADRKIDPDVYAYCFGRGRDKAVEMMQAQNFAFCQRILRVVNQAFEDQRQGGGILPRQLEEIASFTGGSVPRCPSGSAYLLSFPDSSYQIDCDFHKPANGFPQISAPNALLSRDVADFVHQHHQYEQVFWKATRQPSRDDPMFEALAKAARLEPGKKVADVGSGIAFFTYRMLARVSPGGEAWSVDAKPGIIEFVDFVNSRRSPAQRVRTLVSKREDASLPADRFDAVILAHVYRSLASPRREAWEFEQMVAPFVRSIWKGLKVGGRFVIMDGHPEDTTSPLAISRDRVVEEVTGLGFRWLSEEGADGLVGDTPNEYVVVFEKLATPADQTRTKPPTARSVLQSRGAARPR